MAGGAARNCHRALTKRLCAHCALPLPTGKPSHAHCTQLIKGRARLVEEQELGRFIGEMVYERVAALGRRA